MTLQRSQPRHSVRPSLLLDFANGKTLDPRIDFTRASTASFYDGETYAKAEENLLRYSQDATQWSSSNATITGDTQTAPDGTTTADTYESLGDVSSLSRTLSVSAPFTHSIFVKYVDTQYFRLRTSGPNTGTWFDIQNGTIGTDQHDSSSITDVGNGWYRLSITENTTDTIGVQYFLHDTNGSLTEVAGTTYIWGAQLEQRDSLTAYTPTTDQPITNYIPALQTAQNNQARFDHDPVTEESLGLLIEEQRTNELTYSAEFDNWTKPRSSVTANTIVAPDGTLTGDKLVEDTSTGTHLVYRGSTNFTAGDTVCGSVYIKAGERTSASIGAPSGGSGTGINLITGELINVSVPGWGNATTRGAEHVGNGWYRVYFVYTATGNNGLFDALRVFTNNGTTTSYTGDGFSGVYIWGAQLEQGSFPTSYIPTSGSTATRNAESAIMTGDNFSSWYSQGQGTMYCDATCIEPYAGTNRFPRAWEMQGADGSTSNNVIRDVYGVLSGFTDHRPSIRKNNEVQASFATAAETNGNKTALAWKTDDVAYANGGNLVGGTDTSAGIPVVSRLLISAFNTPTSGIGNSYTRKLAYYPQRLTNEELQRLTEA